MQGLEDASCVQDILKCHREFLSTAAEVCMASDKTSWHVIYSSMRKLLDMTLQLHAIGKVYQASLTRLWLLLYPLYMVLH